MKAIVRQSGPMQFVTFADSNHAIVLDGPQQFDGEDTGLRPKELVLSGLAGCTAMDVASLLRKMRVEYDKFEVAAVAELTNEHPKVFSSIQLTFNIWGKEIPEDKLKKAIDLSQERYCGVTAMLQKSCPIEYEYYINGE